MCTGGWTALSCTWVLQAGHPVLPLTVTDVDMVQVVGRFPRRHEVKVNAVSPPGQPLVQLMQPAAERLAAKAPGGIGAPGLYRSLHCPPAQHW